MTPPTLPVFQSNNQMRRHTPSSHPWCEENVSPPLAPSASPRSPPISVTMSAIIPPRHCNNQERRHHRTHGVKTMSQYNPPPRMCARNRTRFASFFMPRTMTPRFRTKSLFGAQKKMQNWQGESHLVLTPLILQDRKRSFKINVCNNDPQGWIFINNVNICYD